MDSRSLCIVLLLTVLCYCEGGKWIKLSSKEVCFGSQANSTIGNFTYQPACNKEVFIGCIKLVRKSGQFSCGDHSENPHAKWGCSNLKNGYVNIVMSDKRKRVIFPKPRLASYDGTDYGYALWYFLPGFSKTSKTISWCDLASPLCVANGQTMYLSHGEDLKNLIHTHNEGKVCVDVFGYQM